MNGSSIAAALWKRVVGLARPLLSQGLAALTTLLKTIPHAWLILWGACALLLAAWGCEHQARLRQTLELAQLQKQTATAVSALQSQAAAAIQAANERNAQAVQELEAKRRQLEHEAGDLATRLQSSQVNERTQAAQVAVLPLAELARRVTQELEVRNSKLETGNSKLEAGSSTDIIQNPNSKIDNSPGPALTLTEPQLRNLAAALVERDACREQLQLGGGQLANCRAQVDTNAAIIRQQVDSLGQLNQALSAKDKILAQREVQQQAELQAARGSRLSRLARVVKYVAAGIVIGAVLR